MEPVHAGQSSFLRKQSLGGTTKAAFPEHSSCFKLCSMLSPTAFTATSVSGLGWAETLVIHKSAPSNIYNLLESEDGKSFLLVDFVGASGDVCD